MAGVSEVMAGLEGRADRPRIIEALAKLADMGALTEMPRGPQRNSPRMFELVKESPYWAFASAEARSARKGSAPRKMETLSER